MPQFRQVWVIQNKVDGSFLSPNLFWVKPLKFAGRCDDVQSAMDTAEQNSNGDGYILSSFWEPVES